VALKSKNKAKQATPDKKTEKGKTAPKTAPKKTAKKEEVPAEKTAYINEGESEALQEQHEADVAEQSQISMKRMEKAVEVVQSEFNLKGKNYSMNLFDDKGKKCVLAVSNEDFDVVVTIKDSEKYDIR
jgi:hypothetical protein